MPSSSKRAGRLASSLRRVISNLFLHRINDPRLGQIQITDVNVSSDLLHAKVYYVIADDEVITQKEVEAGLAQVTSFVRREISRKVKVKFTPQIHFHPDEALLRGRRIEEVLATIEPLEALSEPDQTDADDGEEDDAN